MGAGLSPPVALRPGRLARRRPELAFPHQSQLTPAGALPDDSGMVHNIADITPNGTATRLKLTRTPANWLMISAPTANTGDIRIGDSATAAANGVVIAKGTTLLLPPIGDDSYLDLALIYVFGAAGADKVGVLYGTH